MTPDRFPPERQALAARIAPFPGQFLHAISLNDEFACHTLTLSGHLTASDFAAVIDDGLCASHTSIRDTALDVIALNPPGGVYQPIAVARVGYAAMIRRGLTLFRGDPSVPLSREDHVRILRQGDVELNAEHVRRQTAPDAASRLTSIYVTERSRDGRTLIQSMFRGEPDRFVINVDVPAAIRVTRADVRWFDRFYASGYQADIERYWLGTPFDTKTACWEYLVEGAIRCTDAKQLRKIKRIAPSLYRYSRPSAHRA